MTDIPANKFANNPDVLNTLHLIASRRFNEAARYFIKALNHLPADHEKTCIRYMIDKIESQPVGRMPSEEKALFFADLASAIPDDLDVSFAQSVCYRALTQVMKAHAECFAAMAANSAIECPPDTREKYAHSLETACAALVIVAGTAYQRDIVPLCEIVKAFGRDTTGIAAEIRGVSSDDSKARVTAVLRQRYAEENNLKQGPPATHHM